MRYFVQIAEKSSRKIRIYLRKIRRYSMLRQMCTPDPAPSRDTAQDHRRSRVTMQILGFSWDTAQDHRRSKVTMQIPGFSRDTAQDHRRSRVTMQVPELSRKQHSGRTHRPEQIISSAGGLLPGAVSEENRNLCMRLPPYQSRNLWNGWSGS